MKLKKTDSSKEAKLLRIQKRKVRRLSTDIENLIDEHDFYTFDSEEKASVWFNSFPIETLDESLRMDKNLPSGKLSLHDIKLKKKLYREYCKVSEKLEIELHFLNIANIDFILSKIDGYINNREKVDEKV
jgi:hypothetical protein